MALLNEVKPGENLAERSPLANSLKKVEK